MQFPGQGRTAPGIVICAEFGRGVDEALALGLLYGCEGKGEVRVAGICTTRSDLRSAAFADVLARFFTAPPATPEGVVFQRPPMPIGMPDGERQPEAAVVVDAVLDLRSAEGTPAYVQHIAHDNDTADPVALVRNALTAYPDGHCSVVLAGAATILARLLDLPGAPDLIRRKVKYLIMAAGSYPEGGVDAGVKADVPAAKRLLAQWPGPIVAVGAEVGAALPFPGASVETSFTWAPHHPLVDAYRAFRKMPYDAPAPATAAALYAARPEGYYQLSAPGVLSATDDGWVRFAASADGQHRYLVADPAAKDKVQQAYVELASAKPVPRQRFRRAEKKQ